MKQTNRKNGKRPQTKTDDDEVIVLNPPLIWMECPIGKDVMKDPVLTADGYSYERKAIKEWLTHSTKSPMTRIELRTGSYVRVSGNRRLQQAIEFFRTFNKDKYDAENKNKDCYIVDIPTWASDHKGALLTPNQCKGNNALGDAVEDLGNLL